MHVSSLRKTLFVGFLTISTVASGLTPLAASATYGSYGGSYGGGSHGRGRVPDPKMNVDLKGFKLSGAYQEQSGQPTASGEWQDANTLASAIKNYTEGSCVPILAKVKNQSEKKGDLNLTLTYEYEAHHKLGVNDLEGVTVSGSALSADNLNDVAYAKTSIKNVTSFPTSLGTTVVANVEGPYSGENTGSSPARPFNGTRHYNVELQDVEPGVTVYVASCARLSMDPKKVKSFFDRDEDDDHYGFRYRHDDRETIEIKAIHGGHVKDKVLIDKDGVLNLPSLTLVAKVNGTGATPSQFTFHVSPAINGQNAFTISPGRHSVRIHNVPPQGNYTITETGPSGFAPTGGTGTLCAFSGATATASPVPGLPPENAKCVFENGPDIPATATLKVTKVVINNNGGTMTVSDFPLFVNGNEVVSGVTGTYDPGVYSVTEATSTEYIGTFSGDCDANGNVTLTPGSAKNCTLTNDDVVASLIVTKIVVNNNGGTKTIADFPLFVDGEPVNSGAVNNFGPGAHTVTELADTGYQPLFSGACDANGNVTLALGQTKTCIITNDDIAPRLTITKVVVNDNGGTKTVSDFSLFVGGTPVTSGVMTEFAPGTYAVSETIDPAYQGYFSGDCDASGNVTLAIGESKECVVTNDDAPAFLEVEVNVVNDNGGFLTDGDFQVFIDGVPVNQDQVIGVASGNHMVTASSNFRYYGEWSGDCDADGRVSVAPSENKICTLTMFDVAAGLVVTTKVINDNGGTAVPSDFQIFVQAIGVPPAFTPGSGTGRLYELLPGFFTVFELAKDGYEITGYEGDCSGTIEPDGVYACTIINNDM